MGINGLNLFLKNQFPEISNTVDLSQLQYKTVGIDTSIYLYKYKYNNNNFLELFLKQIFRLKMNNITPIYIFDGKPPVEKNSIIQLRKKKRETQFLAIKRLEEDLENCKSLFETIVINTKIEHIRKKIVKIKNDDISKLKELLNLCGVSYIQSETESDLLFNSLSRYKYIDMVLSEDNDIIVNSNTKLIKFFNVYSNKIIIYDRTLIIKYLGLTSLQWIHFCILMGCDYFKKIPYPSESIYRLIKKTEINYLLNNKLRLEPAQKKSFLRAEELFLSIPEIVNEFHMNNSHDSVALIQFINKNTNLSPNTIDNMLKVIICA
tara:strand:- start:155 stop:1114 length:960 start_codon:yes stop_codon:yes gene_type:complete